MDLDVQQLSPNERYKLLSGCITPRPIAFVSSVSPSGSVNLAPYSFFNAFGANPMLLGFSPLTMEDGDKDTLLNVLPVEEGGTGEFVVNLVVESYLRQAAAAAERLPRGQSEFELVGLASAPSARVSPPRVASSPVSFECRTWQVIRTNPGAPLSGNLVLGEVLHLWVQDDLVGERWNIDQAALRTIGRMGGPSYTRTREQFELVRGRSALEAKLPFPSSEGEPGDD